MSRLNINSQLLEELALGSDELRALMVEQTRDSGHRRGCRSRCSNDENVSGALASPVLDESSSNTDFLLRRSGLLADSARTLLGHMQRELATLEREEAAYRDKLAVRDFLAGLHAETEEGFDEIAASVCRGVRRIRTTDAWETASVAEERGPVARWVRDVVDPLRLLGARDGRNYLEAAGREGFNVDVLGNLGCSGGDAEMSTVRKERIGKLSEEIEKLSGLVGTDA
jgi:hypothetical protein